MNMTNQEAIETIKANWPPESYSMLREALNMALDALGHNEDGHGCTYYEENGKKPYCTHDCYGCVWYS